MWHEPTPFSPDGEGFWVMSRHEDAMTVMLDPVTFSSDKGGSRAGGGTGLKDEYQAGKFLNVRVFRPLPPPHDRIIINPGNATPVGIDVGTGSRRYYLDGSRR